MGSNAGPAERVFKTAWFSKASKKAKIPDAELCKAIAQVMLGQADDLGGGVFKKRLSKNEYRSIIVARAGQFWVFEYLFAKKDMSNIGEEDLVGFRKLTKRYQALTIGQMTQLIADGFWKEICNEDC